MKKMMSVVGLVGLLLGSVVPMAQAASISAIYDFSNDPALPAGTVFEGLEFIGDTLWITSAPNTLTNKRLISVNLDTSTVSSVKYTKQVGFNPVGLASDGTQFFVMNNQNSSTSAIYTSTTAGQTSFLSLLNLDDCQEPEGAAYLNGYVYISCEATQNVIAVNPADGQIVPSETVSFGAALLGLGAADDSTLSDTLIIGDGENHDLILYNTTTDMITERIDLDALFAGYEFYVTPDDKRTVPDPDGLAYHDGKIYMTFEHDLRVFEISLISVPEPTTLALLGLGLLVVAAVKKQRI